jgi:hypothetical protein
MFIKEKIIYKNKLYINYFVNCKIHKKYTKQNVLFNNYRCIGIFSKT